LADCRVQKHREKFRKRESLSWAHPHINSIWTYFHKTIKIK